MSRAYQGLGFAFEGEDDGLSRQLSTTIKGFRSLEDMMPGVGKSFNETGEGLAGFKDKLGQAYGSLKELSTGGTLTTGLEGQIVGLDKDLRKLGVNAGYSGKQLSQFKSKSMGMSLGMKISAEEAADAVHGWNVAQKDLMAVGIDSASTLAKFANVSGMTAKDTVSYLRSLRKEFQFTDTDLSTVTSAYMDLGKATGDKDGAMKNQTKTLELLRLKAQGFGVALPTAELAKFAAGNARLAKAFYSVSGNSQEATDRANEFSTTMLKARKGWIGRLSGDPAEFEAMFKSVGQGFGDIGLAMTSMKQGPDEFMQVMAKLVSTAKKNGQDIARPLAFLQTHMDKAFDPETSAKMVALFRNADQATLDSMATVDKGVESLGKYAKAGFTAGWTLAETFDRQKDMLDMSFRSIGKSAATHLVKESGKSFKQFGSDLKDLAAKGGPIGQVITKFSEMSSIGALALLPAGVRPLGALFGTVTEKMAPMLAQLHSMAGLLPVIASGGSALLKVFSIKGLLLTGVLAFGTYLYSLSDAGTGAAKVFDKLNKAAVNLFEGVATAVEKIPDLIDSADKFLGEFFNGLEKGASSNENVTRWSKVLQRLIGGIGKALSTVGGLLKQFALGFWKSITGTFDASNTSGSAQLGAALGQGLRAAWNFAIDQVQNTVWPAIKNFALGLWDQLTGTIDPAVDATGAGQVGKALGRALQAGWNWAVGFVEDTVWPGITGFVGGLWSGLTGEIDPAKNTTGAAKIGLAIGDALNWAVTWVVETGLPMLYKAEQELASGVWTGIWNALTGNTDGDTSSTGAKGFGEKVGDAIASVASTGASYAAEQIAAHPGRLGPIGWIAGAFMDSPQEKAAQQQITDSVAKAGFASGTSFTSAVDAGMKSSVQSLSAEYGAHLGPKSADIIRASFQAAVDKEALFAQQDAPEIDKRWRKQGVEQMMAYMTHLDSLRDVWSKEFGYSSVEAVEAIKQSLDDGTFQAKQKLLEQKGYFKELHVDLQYTTTELAAMTKRGKEMWEGLASGAKASLKSIGIDTQATLSPENWQNLKGKMTSFADTATSAWGTVKGINAGLTDVTTVVGKKPSAKPGALAPKASAVKEEPLFKYNKEEYKGYRDMISKEVEKTAKNLDKPTQKLVQDVLVSAFEQAYNKIDISTKTFADKQVKVLAKLSTDMKTSLGETWLAVMKQTSIATEAMAQDVGYITGQLKTVEGAFTAVNLARKAASTTTATDKPDLSARKFESTTYQDQMLEATRWPDWYDDQKTTYLEQMALLVAAVKSASTGATPVGVIPASTAAQKGIRATWKGKDSTGATK